MREVKIEAHNMPESVTPQAIPEPVTPQAIPEPVIAEAIPESVIPEVIPESVIPEPIPEPLTEQQTPAPLLRLPKMKNGLLSRYQNSTETPGKQQSSISRWLTPFLPGQV